MTVSLRTAVLVLLTVAVALSAAGCNIGAKKYSVGDCVAIKQHALDEEMVKADCATARGSFDPSKRTYEVKQVLKGKNGNCPSLQGFFPVTFSDEPANRTYCLVQKS